VVTFFAHYKALAPLKHLSGGDPAITNGTNSITN